MIFAVLAEVPPSCHIWSSKHISYLGKVLFALILVEQVGSKEPSFCFPEGGIIT